MVFALTYRFGDCSLLRCIVAGLASRVLHIVADRFLVEVGTQLFNRLAQRLRSRAGDPRFQFIKRDIEIVRNVHRSNELAQILESCRRRLNVGSGRQQRLKSSRQFGVIRQTLAHACLRSVSGMIQSCVGTSSTPVLGYVRFSSSGGKCITSSRPADSSLPPLCQNF